MAFIGGYNFGLMLKIMHRSLPVILVLVSFSLFVWAGIPNQHQTYTQGITPNEIQIPGGDESLSLSSMVSRRVTLEWPNRMRIGETELITLSFEPADGNGTASAAPDENDIYGRYNLMAEGRFEVAGVDVEPANPIRVSMPDGQAVKFKWQISTHQAGSYDGTLWLSLRMLPLDGSQAKQVPILIKQMKIRATSLFGLNVGTVYLLGGLGVVLAGITAYGDFIGLLRKQHKQKTAQRNKVTK